MDEMNKCKICGKEIKKERTYCSISCRNRDPEFYNKRKLSLLSRYNVDNPAKLNHIKEKIKRTNLAKYGVDNPSKSKEIKEKIKLTNLVKYGVDHPMKSEEIKGKLKVSNLKKYNVDNPLKSKEIREKIKQTNLVRYGVDNPFKSKEIKEKLKKTNSTKYGIENPLGSKEIREKIKQTNLTKYGVDHPMKSEEIREKIRRTNLVKYGVETPLKSSNIKDKIKRSNLKKYGVDNPMKSEQIKRKLKASYLKKYGVDNPFKSKEIQEKIKKTNLEKYGVVYVNQKHIKNINDWNNNFAEIYNKFNGNMQKLMEYFGVSTYPIYLRSLELGLRTKYESSFELELKKLLDDNGIKYEQNKYKILDGERQLDFFLPDYNIALECNGLFWHTEVGGNKNRNYHLNKTIKCNEKGIHLIHIWEHLWNQKKEIYWSIIKSHLGLNERIYARKCNIIEVDSKLSKIFYDDNHIQGYVGSSVHIGLEYCGDLVAMMSFGRSRFSKRYEWEMTRYCCAIGKNIVGGAGKLFKYFIDKYSPASIIAYCDRSIFRGNLYKELQFSLVGYSKPNYWYTNDYEHCYSRIKFQKHKLAELLESYDPNLSEWENMKNNGWDRYWDCGNGVWKWMK